MAEYYHDIGRNTFLSIPIYQQAKIMFMFAISFHDLFSELCLTN